MEEGIYSTCADGGPSARIVECARMKSVSARIRRSRINPHSLFGVNHNRVFRTDVLFIRTENTVGARSAQWPHRIIDDFG